MLAGNLVAILAINFLYDENYWEINGNSYPITTSPDLHFQSVTNSIPLTPQAPSLITHPSFTCGYGYVSPIITPLSGNSELPDSICYLLYMKGDGYSGSFQYQRAYDTLRFFIEHCPFYMMYVPSAFSTIGSNVGVLVQDFKETVEHYREWLKSVLYLNPDTIYYCADAIEIATSYVFFNDSVDLDGDAAVTICKWLLDSTHCAGYKNDILHIWHDQARYWQERHWRDTVKDSIATPLDTGYKTLDELNLSILRQGQSGVEPRILTQLNHHPISEARAIPNPMKDEVELWYMLTEGALVRIEIFDALGKQLYSEPQGYKPQGENRLDLVTKDWSSGTYYARLSTLGGETKTIKLIKE
jgi:hypothetical protein